MITAKQPFFTVLAAWMLLVYTPLKADVPVPPTPPAVPTDYCSTLWNEMYGDMQAFNVLLQTPPTWTPVSGGPTVYAAALPWANANTGPQVSSAYYLPSVLAQLQEVKALGVTGVSIPILFPILYEPFFGSQTAMQPYLTFYEAVAQAARAAGLKVIVDDEMMFSNDIQAGWTNMNAFYSTLTWPEYMAARAQMAATIAQYIQPDFLVLANEPDTESAQSGQTNLNIPADAAQMVAGEIAAVQALNLTNPPKLGAGFGTWMTLTGTASLTNYANAYLALPLDYIDYHLLPVNTVNNDNFLDNALTLSQMASAAGKPVAVGQAWLSKTAASEQAGGYDVSNLDLQRSRQTFSFWQPLDAYYMQMMQTLANYEQFLYMDLEQTFFLSAYQPYGGNTTNGGSANCTCTTSSCSDYSIMALESPLAVAADSESVYTSMAFSFYNQLVTTPDTTPPSAPTGLTGTGGITQVGLSWNASTDNVGVAGYNVYRCIPLLPGQSCTGNYVASTTLPSYIDTALLTGTLYNYQVQAFDFVNNHSALSTAVNLQTVLTSGSAATNLVATVISPAEIDLSWSPPSNPLGLGSYLIFSGTLPSNLQQIAVRTSSTTTYKAINLGAGTTYYFGIVAEEQGVQAPMSVEASATTLPLPSPPVNVVGTPSPAKIVLTWKENAVSGGLPVSSYQIFQGTAPGNLVQVGSATALTYSAKSLTANSTYYFEVQAVDSSHDDSTPSDQVAITTLSLPNAPVNVTATANSSTRVTVTWAENPPSNGLPISTFTVLRGPTAAGMTKLVTLNATSFQYIDTTVTAGTTYYYGVEATDTAQDVSPVSTPAVVTTPATPAAPTNVIATANSATQITVTWSETVPPHGLPIASYNILAGTTPTGLSKVASRTTAKYIDTALTPNTTYYFEIQAVDTGGAISPGSPIVSGQTPPMPAAPVNVVATANSATQITVTWVENIPTGGLPISSYAVYRGTTPTGLTKLTTRTATKYIDTGLTAGATYYYAITATDSGGDISPMSATAQATTP
jgi:fibronectin type 3 domain-containing protein